MRYLSVCSGIEAATVAWHPLGWTPVAFSEIEPFPAAVLAHHYPDVPNYGDMTKHKEWPLEPGSIDLLVGGTPCQSFSVAGLRKGISDPRGGLMLTYLEIAQRLRPRWIVWENVPGVLSSGGGRDFGSFLGALVELGYGVAYRVLDAQWVRTQRHPRAVPQRRRRVFVVGCLGDGERAAQVLFERESVQRDSAPRRAPGQGVAADAEPGVGAGCVTSHDVAPCLETTCHDYSRADGFTMVGQPSWPAEVAPTLNQSNRGTGAPGYSDQEIFSQGDGNLVPQPVAIQGNLIGRDEGGPQGVGASGDGAMYTLTKADVHGVAQPVPCDLFQITAPVNRQNRKPGDPCHTLARDNAAHAAVAFTRCDNGGDASVEVTPTMRCGSNYSAHPAVAFPIDTQNMTEGHSSGGLGFGQHGDPSFTVTKGHSHAVAHAFYSTGGTHGVNQHPEVSPAVKVGSGLGIPSPPAVAFTRCDNGRDASVEVTPTMRCGSNYSAHPAVAHAVAKAIGFDGFQSDNPKATHQATIEGTGPLIRQRPHCVAMQMTVRRLTPRECERLQAFPDDYTLIPWRKKPAADCPDGPRYKALGNSMACNCMAWIGERIAAIEAREQ